MKYKVGDMVKVREDLKVDEVYGADSFEPEMAEHRGKLANITKVRDNTYRIDLDNGDWNWTDEMFEDVSDIKDNTLTVADLSKYIIMDSLVSNPLVLRIYRAGSGFDVRIGHNRINKMDMMFNRFMNAYGDLVVKCINFNAVENDHDNVIYNIVSIEVE